MTHAPLRKFYVARRVEFLVFDRDIERIGEPVLLAAPMAARLELNAGLGCF